MVQLLTSYQFQMCIQTHGWQNPYFDHFTQSPFKLRSFGKWCWEGSGVPYWSANVLKSKESEHKTSITVPSPGVNHTDVIHKTFLFSPTPFLSAVWGNTKYSNKNKASITYNNSLLRIFTRWKLSFLGAGRKGGSAAHRRPHINLHMTARHNLEDENWPKFTYRK